MVKLKLFVITHGYKSEIISWFQDFREIAQDQNKDKHINQNFPSPNVPCIPIPVGVYVTYIKKHTKKTNPQFQPSTTISYC